jgi:hypothetical protein
MSKLKAIEVCAVFTIVASFCCAAHSQAAPAQAKPAPTQSESSASSHDPNLTPLQTVQYIDTAIADIRIPEGIDTGSTTTWPGYFAIEQATGTLWWVRGMKTGESQWEIRFSSAQVSQLDLNGVVLGMGVGNYEAITIPCKPAPDGSTLDNCWQNWVASWDDQSPDLKEGHYNSIKTARVVGNENQMVLDGQDFATSPLKKQILLLNGNEKQPIDVEPAKPSWGLQVYLGSANSDSAQRILRAVKYLIKKMPAAVTQTDPFGP